jgi:hypothetical protein
MNTYLILVLGFLGACVAAALTILVKQFIGPVTFVPAIFLLVAGMFFFVNSGRKSLFGIPAPVFFVGTFFYVFIMAGGIGWGFFSLR